MVLHCTRMPDCQIYLTVIVEDAPPAFSRCLADVRERMGGSRLCLNPTKAWVMWMGSKQRLQKIDLGKIPVTSSTVRTTDTVRHIEFKLALLTYKSLYGSIPCYLSDDCQLCLCTDVSVQCLCTDVSV